MQIFLHLLGVKLPDLHYSSAAVDYVSRPLPCNVPKTTSTYFFEKTRKISF